MACYFDEHNCEPLRNGETPDNMLHLARLLLDSGVAFDESFNSFFGNEGTPPPASKKVIEELKTRLIKESDESCAICLKKYDEDDEVKKLPCQHEFHSNCILPWLAKTNSCPVCRFTLPTDDPDYEEYQKQKKRAKQREIDLENLHDSMFG